METLSSLRGPHPVLKQLMPPRSLHPNAREHWRVRDYERNAYLRKATSVVDAYVAQAFDSTPPQWNKCVVAVTFISDKVLAIHSPPADLMAWASVAIQPMYRGCVFNESCDLILLPISTKISNEESLELVCWEGDSVHPPWLC